jgi:hypothetical protein
MEGQVVDKVYSFLVDAAATPITKKFDLDKNVKLVHGILLSSDQPNMLFYRGSQRLEINGEELFPEDYESKLLMSGIAVPPNAKFRKLGNGVVSGNGEVKLQYKDTENPNAPFTSYKVIVVLQCEMR